MARGVLSIKGTLVGDDPQLGNPGHTIQNPSGTDLTQRGVMQFAGDGLSATDDSTNGKTVISLDQDATPTANSNRPVKSGGVASAISDLQASFQAGVDAVYDAVVAKGSTPASHSLADIITAIGNIQTGITPSGTLSITTNGTKDVTQYASANVQVPASAVVSGTKSITTNGTHDVTSYKNASVSVPASAVCSGTINITSNGTKTVTGYKNASVNVPSTHDAVYVRSATSSTAYIKYKIGSGSEQAGALGSSWVQIY